MTIHKFEIGQKVFVPEVENPMIIIRQIFYDARYRHEYDFLPSEDQNIKPKYKIFSEDRGYFQTRWEYEIYVDENDPKLLAERIKLLSEKINYLQEDVADIKKFWLFKLFYKKS